MSTCQGCGLLLEPEDGRPGRPRKYHNDACKMRAARARVRSKPIRARRSLPRVWQKKTKRVTKPMIWPRQPVSDQERALFHGQCLWCGASVRVPEKNCYNYTGDDSVYDECWGWVEDGQWCSCGSQTEWNNPDDGVRILVAEVHHQGSRLCPCPCVNCGGAFWPYCSAECRTKRRRYGLNYILFSGARTIRSRAHGTVPFNLKQTTRQESEWPWCPVCAEAKEDALTEDERSDRILMLILLHGLDGLSATTVVDEPKLYALFEPEEVRRAA